MHLHDESLLRSTAFFGGKWIAADGGETLAVRDPATGAVLAEVTPEVEECCADYGRSLGTAFQPEEI